EGDVPEGTEGVRGHRPLRQADPPRGPGGRARRGVRARPRLGGGRDHRRVRAAGRRGRRGRPRAPGGPGADREGAGAPVRLRGPAEKSGWEVRPTGPADGPAGPGRAEPDPVPGVSGTPGREWRPDLATLPLAYLAPLHNSERHVADDTFARRPTP